MTVLASALSGNVPPPLVQQLLPAAPQPTKETVMEVVTDQSDEKTADGTGVQQLGSKGLTAEDANMA